MRNVVVIDSMVYVHLLGSRTQKIFDSMWQTHIPVDYLFKVYEKHRDERMPVCEIIYGLPKLDIQKAENSIAFMSLIKSHLFQELSRIPVESYHCIFAVDKKSSYGYWRNLFYQKWLMQQGNDISDLHKLGYKGHRPNRKQYPSTSYVQNLNILTKLFILAAQQFGAIVVKPGYEADDIWSTASRWVKSQKDTHLWGATIDQDWLQLVDADTTIYDPRYEPHIRAVPEVLELVKNHKSYRSVINHPRELAAIKQIKGDRGDNLLPGAPLELFDLSNPPEQYRIDWCDTWLDFPIFNKDGDMWEKSKQYIDYCNFTFSI